MDTVLVAGSKDPNIQTLQLEKAEVKYSVIHGVFVDNFLQTTNPQIYALGDCISTRLRCEELKGKERMKYKDYYTHSCEEMAGLLTKNAFLFKQLNWTEL